MICTTISFVWLTPTHPQTIFIEQVQKPLLSLSDLRTRSLEQQKQLLPIKDGRVLLSEKLHLLTTKLLAEAGATK
jgi:hypothetical protein